MELSYDGETCAPSWSTLKPGRYEFEVQDQAQDEIGMELFNAANGQAVANAVAQPSGSADLRVSLQPGGSYRWQCSTPSEQPQNSITIHVPSANGSTASAAENVTVQDLYVPYDGYIAYVNRRLTTERAQLESLNRAIASGSRSAAESAWLAAHITWLSIGQDDGAYGAFGDLGNAIDGTAGGDVGTVHSSSFTGFHRVELDLWSGRPLDTAKADAARLTRLVGSIGSSTMTADFPTTAPGLDSWVLRAHEILEDALRDTLSGDDNYGSDTGLATVGADVTATEEMLTRLQGLITAAAPHLVRTARSELGAIDRTLATLHRAGRPWVAPTALPQRERETLDGEVSAALETLAPISEIAHISTAIS